jgi:hypothetical protein
VKWQHSKMLRKTATECVEVSPNRLISILVYFLAQGGSSKHSTFSESEQRAPFAHASQSRVTLQRIF